MYDKTSFLSGLAMGLCGKGDPIFKGSGKMLYNGVELPDINSVWTDELKATHPYAILQSYQYTYRLSLLQALPHCHYALNQYLIAIPEGNHEMYYPSDGKWAYLGKNTGGSSVAYSFVWTSCDILYKDSTEVYLAASDPVPVEDAFSKGYHVGAELRRKRVLPVAYLYNGMKFPKLPERDKSTYPYAVITYGNWLPQYANNVNLYFLKEIRYSEGGGLYVNNGLKTPSTAYSDDFVWGELQESMSGSAVASQWLHWANTDILNVDGSVNLAASDPVPVYE